MTIKEIMRHAAAQEAGFEGYLNECGQQRITTFYSDMTIAELSGGCKAVQESYNRIKKSWLSNYKYWTEFTMVLNLKIWQHNERDMELARLYDKLWKEADGLFYKTYKNNNEALDHYFERTD